MDHNTPVSERVKTEVNKYPRKSCLSKYVTVESITQWNWSKFIQEAKSHMPVLLHVLESILPDPETKLGCKEEHGDAILQRNQRLGIIVAVIMYTHRPWYSNSFKDAFQSSYGSMVAARGCWSAYRTWTLQRTTCNSSNN